MSALARKQKSTVLYTKGAAEVVLKQCTHILNSDSSVSPMTGAERGAIDRDIDDMACRGLRTLCLAFKEMSPDVHYDEDQPAPDFDLVFACVVGIKV